MLHMYLRVKYEGTYIVVEYCVQVDLAKVEESEILEKK